MVVRFISLLVSYSLFAKVNIVHLFISFSLNREYCDQLLTLGIADNVVSSYPW